MRAFLTRGTTLLAVVTLVIAGAAPTAASGNRYMQLSAGDYHTCGLTSRGAAYCWGYNGSGGLGDGTTTTSGVNGPQRVIGGLKFASIQGGSFFTCGLTASGAAYCWGENNSGQLGDGTTSNSLSPQAVIGGLKFVSISVGYYHTCGITSRGAAYCWGYNVQGQLGDGTTTTSGVNGPQAVQ